MPLSWRPESHREKNQGPKGDLSTETMQLWYLFHHPNLKGPPSLLTLKVSLHSKITPPNLLFFVTVGATLEYGPVQQGPGSPATTGSSPRRWGLCPPAKVPTDHLAAPILCTTDLANSHSPYTTSSYCACPVSTLPPATLYTQTAIPQLQGLRTQEVLAPSTVQVTVP